MEDKAVGWKPRVLDARSLWFTERSRRFVDHLLICEKKRTNQLNEEQEVDKRAPITVKFEIPYFTVSGIQVRYLKIVEKSGYQALPWVRYITQNGDDYRCVVRLNPYSELADKIARSLRTAAEKGSAPIVPM